MKVLGCGSSLEMAKEKGKQEGMKMKVAEIYKEADPEIELLKTAKNNYSLGYKSGLQQRADVMKKQWKEQGKQEIIERAKAYCGLIKTEDDLFKHIDRLEKCSECSKVFWDKLCPTCIREKVDLNIKEMREEYIKMINKCSNIECGWSEYLCERINKEELIQKLNEVKK